MHRGDVALVRQQLVDAQRLRHLLTYALPHLAVQARIELIRVHLALGDPAHGPDDLRCRQAHGASGLDIDPIDVRRACAAPTTP